MRIGGESRTSTAVVDPTSGLQTEINEYGPEVTTAELETLLEKMRYLSGAVSVVVLCRDAAAQGAPPASTRT